MNITLNRVARVFWTVLLMATATPVALVAQAEAGRGALRPYVHVLLAYGVAWILILVWVWRIARALKRLE